MSRRKRGEADFRVVIQNLMIYVYVCFLLLSGVCGLLAADAGENPSIKKQFEAKISEFTGVPVSVSDYEIEFSTVHLHGVKIGDSTRPELPSASIKTISATVDFMSLLGGNLVLKEIVVASLRGRITIDSSGSLMLGGISASASVSLPPEPTDLPFRQISVKDLDLSVSDKRSGQITLLKIASASISNTATTGEMQIALKAKITPADSEKIADVSAVSLHANFLAKRFAPLAASGTVAIEQTSVAALLLLIKDVSPEHLSGINVKAGTVEASLNFVIASQTHFQGSLQVSNLDIDVPGLVRPVTRLTGSLQFDHNHVETAGMKGKWGASTAQIMGQVNYREALNMSLKYEVKPFDLTETGKFLLPADGYTFLGSGEMAGSITGSPTKPVIAGTIKWPSCQIVAPISVDNKNSFIFPFKGLVASYRYSDKTLAIEKASAGLFGGVLSGNGTVKPGRAPVSFHINANGQSIRAEAFLEENTSQKQVVSGPFNATLLADGNTSGLDSWNGRGSLLMRNGKYQAPPVITPVLSLVNLKEFASGDITSANGTFALHKGVLTTADLLCMSTAGKAYYRGDVGLDTTLSGQLNLIFFEEAVKKSQALQQISLDGRSANIPTKVAGTLLAPSFPGFSAGKLLELGLKRTGQKLLQDIIGGGKDDGKIDESDESKPQNTGKKILEDLQNIFKKKNRSGTSPAVTGNKPASSSPEPAKKEEILKKELKKLFKF